MANAIRKNINVPQYEYTLVLREEEAHQLDRLLYCHVDCSVIARNTGLQSVMEALRKVLKGETIPELKGVGNNVLAEKV